jgi:hypothetical protein
MHVSTIPKKSPANKTHDRVVCTCGTTVTRFKYCIKMLNYLYKQTAKIDNIYLNLKVNSIEKKSPVYEKIVTYVKRHPKVILTTVEEKIGPIVRIYPTLLKEILKSTMIVVVHDDVPYHPQMVRHLLAKYYSYPKKLHVVGFKGWNINIKNTLSHTHTVDVLESYVGILFPRGAFYNSKGEDTSKYLLGAHSVGKRVVDDILLCKYFSENNIPLYVVSSSGQELEDPRPWGGSHGHTADEKWASQDNKKLKKMFK